MSPQALADLIRVYDNDLPPDQCQRLIDSFESLARFHQPHGKGYHAALGESAWTELNVTQLSEPGFLGYFRQKLNQALDRYNRDLGLTLAIPNSPKTNDLILKRYRAEAAERFQPHFDALGEHAGRFVVFLWYLNDVAAGGETEFPDLGIKVEARAGRLLMFPPYWMYQHAGRPPAAGSKYILSTYLVF